MILPGGESTTMLSLMLRANLFEPLQFFGKTKPMWGICAGSILMAKEVEHPTQQSLGLLSIKATRNFYGSQKESFKARLEVADEVAAGAPLEADFIRAPLLTSLSETVSVLAYLEKQPVLFQQGHLLASSFHTELGTDARLHQYFLNLVAARETSMNPTPRSSTRAA
jgi:5'-phosphate synthase pdxT subunit